MADTSIKQLIQNMTGGEVQIYQGKVKSVSPLKIQIINDDGLIITSANTYVPEHLTDHTVTVSATTSTADSHYHSISKMTVYGALKKGEKVHLLSLFHGKQYYVLDRVS